MITVADIIKDKGNQLVEIYMVFDRKLDDSRWKIYEGDIENASNEIKELEVLLLEGDNTIIVNAQRIEVLLYGEPFKTTTDKLPWLREITAELTQGAIESGIPKEIAEKMYGLIVPPKVECKKNHKSAEDTITVMFGDHKKVILKSKLPVAKQAAIEAIAEALAAGMTIEDAKRVYGLKIVDD